jgi:hypothetical protein
VWGGAARDTIGDVLDHVAATLLLVAVWKVCNAALYGHAAAGRFPDTLQMIIINTVAWRTRQWLACRRPRVNNNNNQHHHQE